MKLEQNFLKSKVNIHIGEYSTSIGNHEYTNYSMKTFYEHFSLSKTKRSANSVDKKIELICK